MVASIMDHADGRTGLFRWLWAGLFVAICVALIWAERVPWCATTLRLVGPFGNAGWTAMFAAIIYSKRKKHPTQSDIDRGDGPIMNWVCVSVFAALSLFSLVDGVHRLFGR